MNTLDDLTMDQLKKIVTDSPYFEAQPDELETVDDYRAVVVDGLYWIVESCKGADTEECYDIINTIDNKELRDYVIDVLGI